MAKSAFVSFDYDVDNARVQQVLNMGVLDGDPLLSPQEWETVKRGGDDAIRRWINSKMASKSVVVVLVGAKTASSKWVDYEIRRAWNEKIPLTGVRIHGLKNFSGRTSTRGADPFAKVSLQNGRHMSDFVKLYDPPGTTSTGVYASIQSALPALMTNAYKRS